MATEQISTSPAIAISSQLDQICTTVLLEHDKKMSDSGLANVRQRIKTVEDIASTVGEPAICESASRILTRMNGNASISAGDVQGWVEDLRAVLKPSENNPETDASAQCEAPSSVAQDPELIADFIVESREHLTKAESLILQIEEGTADGEAVHSLFRSFHSIKGLAGFLEIHRIQAFAHEVESLLGEVRDGRLAINGDVVEVVLASTDVMTQLIDALASNMLNRKTFRDAELIQTIRTIMAASQQNVSSDLNASNAQMANHESLNVSAERQELVPTQSVTTEQKVEAERSTSPERYSVRVDTNKLDYLMDMVGEMVIAESLIETELNSEQKAGETLQRNLSRLSQITSEVQRTTMALRLVPIGQLFRRTARIVRDLAKKCGKQVEVELKGEDTEVDKSIAEELADPLMHMVRNSIDHGIEDSEDRLKSGKSKTAKITMAAYHLGSQIVIELADDGKGLDRDRILQKARERGLIGDQELSEGEVYNLIFSPGFSTAAQVTAISGRGVGMDVVRQQVEKLRGNIDTETRKGIGTKFILKLPLTRAIIDGLVVAVGERRYIVPIASVQEVLKPNPEDLHTVQGKGEIVCVHDRLLPIVRLHRKFSIPGSVVQPHDGVLIVSDAGGRGFCLLIDSLIGKQEVVIKSIGSMFKNIEGISGGTILGDGKVGLILDMHALGEVTRA